MPNLESDEFLVGFTGDLGIAWWASREDLGITQFPASVPLSRAIDLLDWQPERISLPFKYADHEQPMIMLVHPETRNLVGLHTAEYPTTNYRERLLDNVSALIDDEIGTKIGCVGLLAGGRQAFVQITLDDIAVHEPTGERFKMWLCAYSSLDGSLANTYQTGAMRIQCRNTFEGFRRTAERTYKYRNTANNRLQVATAREVLDLFGTMTTDLFAEIDRMVLTPVSDSQWEQILDRAFPTDGLSKRGQTRRQNLQREVDEIYRSDSRVGYVGTQWGALQAFTTWLQHEAEPIGGMSKAHRNMTHLMEGRFRDSEMHYRRIIDSVLATV